MTRSRRSLGSILFALVALLSSASLAAQDVALRYRWTKGEEQRYRTTTQTDMVMSGIPGMGDMTVVTTMVQVTKMVADDVAADGTATIRMVYESVKMNMAMPMMGEVSYDSAAPPAAGNPLTDALKPLGALVGEPFTIVVSVSGKVLKIDGLTPILDKARAGLASAAGAAGFGGGGDVNTILSDASQRATLEQSFVPMPDKPLKVGETWKNAFKIPNPFGAQAASQVFTLKEATGATARIAAAGTMKPEGAPGAMGPMTVTMGDGTSQGDITFNVKLGRMQKMTSVLVMPLSMSMAAPDGTNLSIQASSK